MEGTSDTNNNWMTKDDWEGLEWRIVVPLALGNGNVYDNFESVLDERVLLREPSQYRSARVNNPNCYVSVCPLVFTFFFFILFLSFLSLGY